MKKRNIELKNQIKEVEKENKEDRKLNIEMYSDEFNKDMTDL